MSIGSTHSTRPTSRGVERDTPPSYIVPSRSYRARGKPVHKGNTTRVDDVVTVSVTYNKPVQVFGAPTLTIDAGRDREAVYSGGNASRTIFFEYVVRVADVTSRLGIPASQSEINDGYTDGACSPSTNNE